MTKSHFNKNIKLFRRFARTFGVVVPRDIEIGRISECETVSGPRNGVYHFNCDFKNDIATGSIINPNCSG